MPGLAQRNNNDQLSNATSSSCCFSLSSSTDNNGSVSSTGFWSKHRDDISYNQLQKFLSDLPSQARQKLLRIDKQNLFEQARKNMYCSRCNGLLLEGFFQIVMYGKSLQQEGISHQFPGSKHGTSKNQINSTSSDVSICQDETQDPSVHPWGGLTTTKDGALTLLDCYLYSQSLKGLQNVFDSARARERERELLYPDACGGGGRGWISQGMASYGRGHGTRETCALHTARLSCDTLVDFWSALGEDTRQSLLKMKEEDFMERLMYRFDSKRFCRDCRRNVIREFKELKELKRMRREPRCTSWFCVADTAFKYEVSNDTIQADWHQTFMDAVGTYHHFEWGVGTGEGKSDILEFENVGMNGSVQVNGLDLGGLSSCYITLKAWKLDGRCNELSVEAHALKGQKCVHCRLIVGDGYVTITRGESIRRFFEHAEEAEEEEDDDSMDKDGNELDGECSRPQKHAKSPELAREFLLDAATVIFKEQVEKAFREGTARQNAHSIFVCLSLKLLEDRVHVACKEIITLEKQMKLLEEEEKEKREEQERKERRRTKEREKKLRRKERLRGKDREKKCSESDEISVNPGDSGEARESCIEEKPGRCLVDMVSEVDDTSMPCPTSPKMQDDLFCNGNAASDMQNEDCDGTQWETADAKDESGSHAADIAKVSRRKKLEREFQPDVHLKWPERRRSVENGAVSYKSDSRCNEDVSDWSRGTSGTARQTRSTTAKYVTRNGGPRFSQKLQSSSRNDSCGCNQQIDLRAKADSYSSVARLGRESRKLEMSPELTKPGHRGNKTSQIDHMRDNCLRGRAKVSNYNRDLVHTKKVWEPVEPQKRYPRSNSDSDVTLKLCTNSNKSVGDNCSADIRGKSDRGVDNADSGLKGSSCQMQHEFQNGLPAGARTFRSPKETADEEVDLRSTRSCNFNGTSDFSASSSSASDNCSSCLSEGDSNTASSNPENTESSSTSDSEESSPHSDGKEAVSCIQNGFSEGHEVGMNTTQNFSNQESVDRVTFSGISECAGNNLPWSPLRRNCKESVTDGKIGAGPGSLHQGVLPQNHNQNFHYPVLQAASTMGYYHQNPVSWSTSSGSGLMPYPHPNQYLYTSPFGYNLAPDSHYCMQYGAVQQLASPLLNPAQIPVYQPVLGASGLNAAEQTNLPVPTGTRDVCGDFRREKLVPAGKQTKAVPSIGGLSNGNSTNLGNENTGFSLFQFGGPAALPSYQSNSMSSNEGVTGKLRPNLLADHVEGDHACSKREAIVEQYNLFANGIKFSIF